MNIMWRKFVSKIKYVILAIGTSIFVFPAFWVMMSSLKGRREFTQGHFFPQGALKFGNYIEAWLKGGMAKYYLNSIIVTLVAVSVGIFFSSLAAYAFSRLEFRGREVLFYLFLAMMMLPPQLGLIPLFLILKNLGLYNSRMGLILPYIGGVLPLSIFLMRGYLKEIPPEMDEAAKIDGANHWQIYSRIIMPLTKPILATCIVMAVHGTWNEFLLATTLIKDDLLRTIPVGIVQMQVNSAAINYPRLMAANVISFLPLVIVFIFLQKYFVKGVTGGALD
ncbi:carbohydrate ABC transporter permease [Halanaerocella petrolearia]